MTRLTDDMARLRGEIENLRNARMASIHDVKLDVAGIKTGVTEMRADFRKAHADMAQAARAGRHLFIGDIATFVSGLAEGVAEMQAGFRQTHAGMARTARMERQQFVADIAAYVSELAESVAEMQAGFRQAHAEMARGSKAERRQFVEGIVAKVSALAEDVAAMQAGIRDALAQMAEAGQSERAEFLAGLTRTVDELKRMVAEMRQDAIGDLEGACHAWSGQGQRPGRKKKEPVRRQAAAAVENTATATVRTAMEKGAGEGSEDDLTVISGIGPGRMERLREAGILSFARLAAMKPEEVRAILGPPGKMVEVESWIERARELAGLS